MNRRADRVLRPPSAVAGSSDPPRRAVPPRAAALVAAAAAWLVLPSWFGAVLAVGIALGAPPVLARLEPRAARKERESFARDLPLAVDLIAAALSAGATPASACHLVGAAVGGAAGQRLERVGVLLDLGAAPHDAWARWAPGDGDARSAQVASALAHAGTVGGSASGTLTRLAQEQRASARRSAEARARRITVRIAGPLGLCFLPAFILLAVVPAVVGALAPALA